MRYRRKLHKNSQGYFSLPIPREIAVDLVGPEGGDVWVYCRPGAVGIIPVSKKGDKDE